MPTSNKHLLHARTLQADILASPDIWLPRRDDLLQWLNEFMGRAKAPSFELGETEAEDLTTLDHFLRGNNVPVAAA